MNTGIYTIVDTERLILYKKTFGWYGTSVYNMVEPKRAIAQTQNNIRAKIYVRQYSARYGTGEYIEKLIFWYGTDVYAMIGPKRAPTRSRNGISAPINARQYIARYGTGDFT